MIPHSKPALGLEESEAVARVISSGMIAEGETVREFEKQFAIFLKVKGAAAVNSGTSGLHLALLSLGLKKDDEVVIPSLVCTALLNAINYIGAKVSIAEINEHDYNLSLKDVRKRITPKTKAIILPHIFGRASDEIIGFKELDIPIIEDCAQSLGSMVNGEYTGTIGDIGVFSFYATKVMTTGEGGMVVSNSDKILEKIFDLREYDHKEEYKIRYNYKMTDLQAAIGLEQLKKLPLFIQMRQNIADKYYEKLNGLPLQLPDYYLPLVSTEVKNIWYRYIISSVRARELIYFLQKNKIGAANPIFKPLHRFFHEKDSYPATEKLWNSMISIPIYPSLTSLEIQKIVDSIKLFFHQKNSKS